MRSLGEVSFAFASFSCLIRWVEFYKLLMLDAKAVFTFNRHYQF